MLMPFIRPVCPLTGGHNAHDKHLQLMKCPVARSPMISHVTRATLRPIHPFINLKAETKNVGFAFLVFFFLFIVGSVPVNRTFERQTREENEESIWQIPTRAALRTRRTRSARKICKFVLIALRKASSKKRKDRGKKRIELSLIYLLSHAQTKWKLYARMTLEMRERHSTANELLAGCLI